MGLPLLKCSYHHTNDKNCNLKTKKRRSSFVGFPDHFEGCRVYNHDHWIIIEHHDAYFLEDPIENPRDKPLQVEFYEVSKDKDLEVRRLMLK